MKEKSSKAKLIFRQINDGLNAIPHLKHQDMVATVDALKAVNEEMCDKVLDLIKKLEYYERRAATASYR